MESFYSLKTGLNCYVVIEVIGMFRFTFYLHFFVGLNFLFGKFPKTVQQVSVIIIKFMRIGSQIVFYFLSSIIFFFKDSTIKFNI